MKVLTKTALGALVERTPDDVNLHMEKSHVDFLNAQFKGCDAVWDSEYMHYKFGDPGVVSSWLKEFGFDKEFGLETEFVMAAVIELLMKFKEPAAERIFSKNGETFKRALHEGAYETTDSDIFTIPLFGEIKEFKSEFSGGLGSFTTEHEDLKIYISNHLQPFDKFNGELSRTFTMDLHVPFAEAELEESLDEFKGMKATVLGEDCEVSEAGVITKFKIDCKGAEARQAAFIGMMVSACMSIPTEKRHKRVEVIDGNYYVYITIRDNLAFAVEIETEDFVEGKGRVDDVVSAASYVSKSF